MAPAPVGKPHVVRRHRRVTAARPALGARRSRKKQVGDGCLIPGNVRGQAGRGSEQPGLAVDVPARCKGVGLDDL